MSPGHRSNLVIAAGLLAGFLLLYLANGDFLPASDPIPSVYLPLSVLDDGNLTFTPEEAPFMFVWNLEHEGKRGLLKFNDWEAAASTTNALYLPERKTRIVERSNPTDRQSASEGGEADDAQPLVVPVSREDTSEPTTAIAGPLAAATDQTWRDLRCAGRLTLAGNDYYVFPRAGSIGQEHVSAYGIGAGLTALPLFALLSTVVDDLAHRPAAVWFAAKFVASLCVAVSVAVVFLCVRRFVGLKESVLIALAFGAGTCMWSMASQTLWQHGPNAMFLSIGIYCLLQIPRSAWWAAGCGAMFGCAVLCRPTMALVVIPVGLYLLATAVRRYRERENRPSLGTAFAPLVVYVVAGLPFALIQGYYSWLHLGSPWASAQMEIARRFTEATGGPWRTPLVEGACGILFSPSRGLFVYSPILLFSFWGIARLWRDPRLHPMRPLSAAALLLVLMQSKWYSWYGGHSFGYRLLVDTVPLLAVCSVAVVPVMRRKKVVLALFVAALAWSVGVQVIGAYAYNTIGWNCRRAYLVTPPGQARSLLVTDPRVAQQHAGGQHARLSSICMNIDVGPFRRRLWSVRDSQLIYYATHFRESRQLKKEMMRQWLELYVTRFPNA
jgi:hypothetical protein